MFVNMEGCDVVQEAAQQTHASQPVPVRSQPEFNKVFSTLEAERRCRGAKKQCDRFVSTFWRAQQDQNYAQQPKVSKKHTRVDIG